MTVQCSQCFCFSRNIGSVTRKIGISHFLDQGIRRIFYLILKIEALKIEALRTHLDENTNWYTWGTGTVYSCWHAIDVMPKIECFWDLKIATAWKKCNTKSIVDFCSVQAVITLSQHLLTGFIHCRHILRFRWLLSKHTNGTCYSDMPNKSAGRRANACPERGPQRPWYVFISIW